MGQRTTIGVTGPDRGGLTAWLMTALAVLRSGAKPVRITPGKPCEAATLDGVIIGGGTDVDPFQYGEEKLPENPQDAAQGSSHYLRTKGEAENYMHTISGRQIQITTFRPSVIFGPGDSFLNRFADLLKKIPLFFPLACPDSRFAPVYVEDVAKAFIQSIDDRDTFSQRYDLCGPHEYTLRELVEYTARTIGVNKTIIGLPDWASQLQARMMELVPGKPFSMDNYRSLQVDSVCKAGTDCCPTPLEAIAPGYLGHKDFNTRMQVFRSQANRD